MELDARINLFRNMVGCCHDLYLWTYDCAMHLISTNCPTPDAIHNLFMTACQKGLFRNEIEASGKPLLLTNEMNMVWLTVPQIVQQDLIRVYVLGPCFMDDVSTQNIQSQLLEQGLTKQLRDQVTQFLSQLPIISWNRVQEYAIMLYYCINEERIDTSDLRFSKVTHTSPGNAPAEPMQVHGTYQAEQEMLRMVREGDLNLTSHINRMAVTGNMGKLSNGDSLRQIKNTVFVCITLFSRAAIEGGLSPELSLTLTDHYFQSIETCNTISEITEITRIMQSDFVQRVHRCRTEKMSKPVRTCCDYISLHLEEEISLSDLAKQTSYADYYISKKFKKETGKTPADYIRQKRLERAAFLLRTTQEDIQDISDRLLFGTHSYFSDSFKKQFGVSPSEYRANQQ